MRAGVNRAVFDAAEGCQNPGITRGDHGYTAEKQNDSQRAKRQELTRIALPFLLLAFHHSGIALCISHPLFTASEAEHHIKHEGKNQANNQCKHTMISFLTDFRRRCLPLALRGDRIIL